MTEESVLADIDNIIGKPPVFGVKDDESKVQEWKQWSAWCELRQKLAEKWRVRRDEVARQQQHRPASAVL